MNTFERILADIDNAYLDTNILVYHLEDSLPYSDLTQIIFELMIGTKIKGHTSVLGIMELNVGHYKKKQSEKAWAQTEILSQLPGFMIHPFDLVTADRAALLRAEYNFKSPDAIHAATALESRCDTFIGNDKIFSRLPKIRYIHLNDFIKK